MYNELNLSSTNVKYINKDFSSLKSALVQYAKAYFPNTYKDFNETSPGMMMIEMSAYVGDVLSFYIDQQYREMMLPLAEERRNVVNMAKMLGYKVKPISPAYVELTVKQTVPSDNTDETSVQPEYDKSVVIDKGMKITSAFDSTVVFETLGVIDFTMSSSIDKEPDMTGQDSSTTMASEWTLERKIKAISGETKTKTFNIGAPSKFLKLTLSDINVVDIVKIEDTNGSKWYEVDFLAQDKIPLETYYLDDVRSNAYSTIGNTAQGETVSVPYSLEYIRTTKRFIKEINDDNTTSLIFGNGVIRSGQQNLETALLQTEQAGLTFAGQTEDLQTVIDPLLGDGLATLGEMPNQTTLTVTYRVGGGISANVPSSDLYDYSNVSYIGTHTSLPGNTTLSVTNVKPAVGGSDFESVDEIRERAKTFFSTQNRCVTKEDYEARILNMSAKFGNIAKVYVERIDIGDETPSVLASEQVAYINNVLNVVDNFLQYVIDDGGDIIVNSGVLLNSGNLLWEGSFDFNNDDSVDSLDITSITEDIMMRLGTIRINILSYDNNKNLIGDPWVGTGGYSDGSGIAIPNLIHLNLKNYLNQFRILTDEITIQDGYIINFGVIFDVVAHKHAINQEVQLGCIQKIKDYFTVDKMQFRQPIYTSDIEYELMSVDGVRAVNHVTITQDADPQSTDSEVSHFDPGLFDMTIEGEIIAGGNNSGYGYLYDFPVFYGENHPLGIEYSGLILPSVDPAVFELKNPNENIKGIVR